MTIKQDVLAEAKRQQTAVRRIMFLGNGTIVAVPGGLLNQVYATDVDLNVNVIFNTAVPNYLDYPVWVELVNKKLQVTSAWDVYGNFVATRVGPHWWTHAFGPGGVDIVPISGDQWLPWIVQPATTTDFTINIYRTPIYTTGGWVAGGVENYDMTSLIPTSGAYYVLMSVESDGIINYTSGPIEATPADLTTADYPALPSGDKPLYLVMLYSGMVPPLQYNPALSNFIDVRHMQAGGGGSLPTLDADRVVITDGSGAITTDPNFNYNAGLLVMGAPTVPASNPNDLNIVGSYPAFSNWGYDTTAGNAPSFLGLRSRGTIGSPAAVTANDVLARFRGKGWYDGSNQSRSTELRVVADEDFDSSHQGTRIELWGTPDGATTPQLMVTIYGDGRIVSSNDIEITDATKGIILKDTVTGTRYRISVTGGAVTAAPA